ncbi:hypothetical protein DMUE_2263 [Dictyocoela muelleri]|nr:hypothetical protein DMUE_2263 [Dictyocoela muelleri]
MPVRNGKFDIHDFSSIYAVINTTEETMIEQIKSAKMSSRISLKQNEINQGTQQANHKAKKKMYCEYHKVSKHDTTECRTKKQATEKVEKHGNKPKESQMFAMKETPLKISALESRGYINETKVNLTFDTGPAYSYIDEGIVRKLKLKHDEFEKKKRCYRQ